MAPHYKDFDFKLTSDVKIGQLFKNTGGEDLSYNWSRFGHTLRPIFLLWLVGNPISDGIIFVVHLSWCVRGFISLERFWPYLIAFSSCILNGKLE